MAIAAKRETASYKIYTHRKVRNYETDIRYELVRRKLCWPTHGESFFRTISNTECQIEYG